MKKLIRKILREQEEEDFSPVIPIFNYAKKYKDVYNYLDLTLKGLVKRKAKYFEGIVFAYPDEEYGILKWNSDGILFIYPALINEISSKFNMNNSDSISIIGKWFTDRYKLEVKDTEHDEGLWMAELAIDTN